MITTIATLNFLRSPIGRLTLSVREDKNGTKASATYTPTVTPVTPTATPAVSTDIQGATQTGKPVFTEGDSRVPMNDDVPATFDDGSTTKTVKGVGTYTVAPDGTVTFVPEKSFVGTAPAVTVVREDKNGTKSFCNLYTNSNSCDSNS